MYASRAISSYVFWGGSRRSLAAASTHWFAQSMRHALASSCLVGTGGRGSPPPRPPVANQATGGWGSPHLLFSGMAPICGACAMASPGSDAVHACKLHSF